MAALTIFAKSELSSDRTSAKVRTAAVFLWTTVPSLALFFLKWHRSKPTMVVLKKLLTYNDHVWDTHLAAKGGKEDDEFDWVDIISDHDQASLLGSVGG